MNLKSVAEKFRIEGRFIDAKSYGCGHINDTYAVNFDNAGISHRYIIQKINNNVFKDPPALMENIERVTKHIRMKLEKSNINDISRRVMTIIRTTDGRSFYKDENDGYWRTYLFIERAETFNQLASPNQAYEAARVFGEFQKMLIDLPGKSLNETIPFFHHGPTKYDNFIKVVAEDPLNRAAFAKEEIAFLKDYGSIFNVFPQLVDKGEIDVRPSHNDCKINNIMFDEKTKEGICVVDLDTVMPGLNLYDFGDMVRTCISPTAEDETNLDIISVDAAVFEMLAKGYISSAGEILSKAERDHLLFAGKMITLMIGARFLTDFLEGDSYFKVDEGRKNHNLDRCRAQFKLVKSIIENEKELQAIADRI